MASALLQGEIYNAAGQTLPDIVVMIDLRTQAVSILNRLDLFGYRPADMQSTDWLQQVIHPDEREDLQKKWDAMQAGDEIAPAVLQFKGKNKQWEWLECRPVILEREADGRVARLLLAITILTRLVEMLEGQDIQSRVAFARSLTHMLSHAHNQEQRFDLVNEIVQVAMTADDLGQMLSTLANHLREILDAEVCAITLWDADRQIPSHLISSTRPGLSLSPLHFEPGEDSFTGAILKANRAIYIEDAPRQAQLYSQLYAYLRADLLFGLPLSVGDHKIGAIIFGLDLPHSLTSQEQAKWEQIAAQISLAVFKAQLFNQEQKRRLEAAAIQRAISHQDSPLNLEEILKDILGCLFLVIPFESASILLEKEHSYQVAAWRGIGSQSERIGVQVAKDQPALMEIRRSGQPLVLHDARAGTGPWEIPSMEAEGTRGWMGVPLVAFEKTIGILTVASYRPDIYTEESARHALAFANQAAVAIASAELFNLATANQERLRVLSSKLITIQEEERRNLALELHDEIGQALTGIIYSLEMAKRLPPEMIVEKLSETQNQARKLIQQVRELSLNLRPVMLDELGLLAALEWQIAQLKQQTGIQVALEHSGLDQRFSPEVELAAFRIVQESLTNIARYADVDCALVSARVEEYTLRLKIMDQGRGFDKDQLADGESSFGLMGIMERARQVNGQFELVTEPGKGTIIEVQIPIGY